jgi:hypothetical protein
MKVQELVARFATAGESADPMNAARQILEDLGGDIGAVDRALDYVPGVGGNARQVFYRSPQMTLLKVVFPAAGVPRRMTTAPGRRSWCSAEKRKTRYTETRAARCARRERKFFHPGPS